MVSEITQGVKVSVETQYVQYDEYNKKHTFAYHIDIQNSNDFTVRLLRRQWFIIGTDGDYHEVEGEGVIGVQPSLEPDTKHAYTSGCHLTSPIGKMVGTYLFKRLDTDEFFRVRIPEFHLIAPFLLN